MRALCLISLCVLVGVITTGIGGRPAATISYTFRYTSPGSATVHVRMALAAAASPRVLLIPRAVPMGYDEEPYDSFVSNVRAFDSGGKALQVSRGEGPRWRVGPAAVVEYDVDLARMEQDIRDATDSSRIRPGYASLLGYSLFGLIEGTENLPIELHVEAPKGWPVFSTLSPAGGAIHAPNFYALADSQTILGPTVRVVKVQYPREKDVPLTLAVYSEAPVDQVRLERLAGEAMADIVQYFDGPELAPFQHFTVFLEFLKPISEKHTYGFGMEHLESFHAALAAADADPAAFPDGRLRYHIAHHIAHAWIPKRCYGEGYYPFTWDHAPRIDTIWFSEGFAQYAAIAAIAAPPAAHGQGDELRQEMLTRRFRNVLRDSPAELRHMPLRELSLLASTQYAADFRIGQLTFSRGGLMAEEMDDRIHAETHGQKSLRDALRHLIAWSAQNHRAFRVEELPVRFREATGVDVQPILEKWLAPLE